MKPRDLVLRGIVYYWRTNAAVVLGVATAVAVLAGALLVGDSVRGSLRDLVLQRIGRTDRAVVSTGFFREALSEELAADAAIAGATPLIAVEGVVSDQASGRRASRVQVYGVDDRFWRFHAVTAVRGPEGREVLINRTLASDIGAAGGSTVLVRIERPSAIPIESLHGRKENAGRTLRLSVRAIVAASDLGDFSLRPQQGDVRAVFVPLKRLQQDLDLQGRVNTLLFADGSPAASGAPASPRSSPDSQRAEGERLALQPASADRSPGRLARQQPAQGARGFPPSLKLRRTAEALAEAGQPSGTDRLETALRLRFALDDVGLSIRVVGGGTSIAVESAAGFLDATRATAVGVAGVAAGLKSQPILTYLANSLRSGDRQIPYSLVTAIDLPSIAPPFRRPDSTAPPGKPPVVLNDWAARDLAVKIGDPLTLEYYLWEDPGRLVTRTADFEVAAIVPIAGAAADREFAPVYPGITEAASLGDWDPPFPIDLSRVRRVDEEYWAMYRTTAKAFVPLEVGQMLWHSRYGDRTSVRFALGSGEPAGAARERYAAGLRAAIDPFAMGLSVREVRGAGLAASRGATDFGEYFTYFSVFLVASALLLAALFFRLALEQRGREIGLLRAVGFSTARVRRLFATEGFALAVAGSVLGAAGAVAYGAAMMYGLRTWWVGAVATRSLTLHVSPVSLVAGAAGALAAAMMCIWWTLRGLARLSERSLLAGNLTGRPGTASTSTTTSRGRRPALVSVAAIGFAILGLALMVSSAAGVLDRAGAFFGAGTSLLVACLCLATVRLRRPPSALISGRGWRAVSRLGLRNAADRPGRSVLAIGVIASATFILISVDAFHKDRPSATDRHSGVGGYPLLVNLLLPLASDPNSREGRDAIGLGATSQDQITIEPFRVRPGDDASCLNLYEPATPRILGARQSFIDASRFTFQSSMATTDAERANPWLLLNRELSVSGPEAVPVIADANSMTYVLHKSLGDEIVVDRGGQPLRLRLVAALADSIFQGELLMSDANFLRLFPEQEGYRFLLVDTAADRAPAIAAAVEQGAGDLGADAMLTVERLAEFHAVENTYLSTFKTLGGLGLLVGTIGLAAVLLRNVLERRRELALLGATGYRRGHIFAIIVAENALLLGWGLAAGALCAGVAIAPVVLERGGRWPAAAGAALLLIAVCAAGLLSSVVATSAALRAPLLEALRAE